MKITILSLTGIAPDFSTAKQLADANADILLNGEAILLSWYDRNRDFESPSHVNECHNTNCETPGYIEYANNRGGTLQVDIDKGRFVFCYRPLGEFS